MNTIIMKLNKKLLKCNISTAVSPNNGPPFSKGKTTTFMKPDQEEDPQFRHAARDKDGEMREIWKFLLKGEVL